MGVRAERALGRDRVAPPKGITNMSTSRLLVFSPLALSALGFLCRVCEGAGDGRPDIHSYARPDQIRVTKVELDLKVDFEERELRGSAVLSFERQPGCPADARLWLDSKGLLIEGVRSADVPDQPVVLEHTVGAGDPILGSPVSIAVPPGAAKVRVDYKTTLRSKAIQWIEPAGTSGGKAPFLFTQSEAIHARSWIPLQDSPAVRVTYAATIRISAPLKAVMSADLKSVQESRGRMTYTFDMPQPVPAYLIALAVGNLSYHKLGVRTGVYAEPSVVEKAAAELVDTEAMVETIEKRFGPYRWGRYDLLILPPSFPFGGMENPKLTFATPTILAGDRSLVSLVAHELAHSWSGNLVTNATWSDFWLNEGFTTYLERRLMEDLYGPDRAAMERLLGLDELKAELATADPRDQVLHIDLAGRDPDDGMTRVPYEKGALFLTTIETAFGRERFDRFLLAYFNHFAFQSITTADFLDFLREQLLMQDAAAAKRVDFRAWTEEPGLPAGYPVPVSDRLAKVEAAARDWSEGRITTDQLSTGGWSTHEWLHFLQKLPQKLSADQLAALDKAFALTDRGNAEIAQEWLSIAIRNSYAPADQRIESFLTSIGRRKFLIPLYTELAKTPEGLARAKMIYAKARAFYHPIAAESVAKLLAKAK
jgi:aminopeptidase N